MAAPDLEDFYGSGLGDQSLEPYDALDTSLSSLRRVSRLDMTNELDAVIAHSDDDARRRVRWSCTECRNKKKRRPHVGSETAN